MATTAQVQALYIAYFGRPADPAGLKFWTNGTLSTKQQLDGLADEMANSNEFKASIAGKTNTEIINQIYQNLFNRNADAAGLAFWLEALGEDASGVSAPNFQVLQARGPARTNPQDIGTEIVFAVQDKQSPDADSLTVNSKVIGSQEFTDCVEDEGVEYIGAVPISQARAFVNKIILPRDIPSGSEVCVIVRNLGRQYNPGGGDVTANGGGVINGVLTSSRCADRVDSWGGGQYEYQGDTLGPLKVDLNYRFDKSDQICYFVNSNDATTNTLQSLDSFRDGYTSDSDSVTIKAIGPAKITNAIITNLENVTFDLLDFGKGGAEENLHTTNLSGGKNLVLQGTIKNDIRYAVTTQGFNTFDARLVRHSLGADGDVTLAAQSDGTSPTTFYGSQTLTTKMIGTDGTAGAGVNVKDTFNLGGGAGNTIANIGNNDVINSVAGFSGTTAATINAIGTVDVNVQSTGLTITVAGGIDSTVDASDSTSKVTLVGGAGVETYKAGIGGDEVTGALGADIFTAGAGVDIFNYAAGQAGTVGASTQGTLTLAQASANAAANAGGAGAGVATITYSYGGTTRTATQTYAAQATAKTIMDALTAKLDAQQGVSATSADANNNTTITLTAEADGIPIAWATAALTFSAKNKEA